MAADTGSSDHSGCLFRVKKAARIRTTSEEYFFII
jgi:hypothetical protein